ncbi:hypothetical protein FRC04_010576 [Tulasnella sp. 424]|nr:hypothetical protein FRC04_010576 [Tulasnella sp. 424]KAG8972311.1 hypothetical protein FRC05_010153 [Tulasnella sp. 425]
MAPKVVEPQVPPTQILQCKATDILFEQPTNSGQEESCLIDPASDTYGAIHRASCILKQDRRPVVIPTETVYGLAAAATDSSAVEKIFTTKGRPADNPLIVHVSSRSMLSSLLPPSYTIPSSYERLMKAFWPGPLTLLFPADPSKIPPIVTAGQKTVAIRMPSHPVARALISFSHTPLAAPSANSSGRPSPTKAEHVWDDLGKSGKVPLILDGGPCNVGVESTVVDGISADDGSIRVLRPGGVTVEEMKAVLSEGLSPGESPVKVLVHKRDYQDAQMEQHPTTPGMKYLHYTPSVPVILLNLKNPQHPPTQEYESVAKVMEDLLTKHESRSEKSGRRKVGFLVTSDFPVQSATRSNDSEVITFDLGPRNEPSVAAQRLFDGLLTLEKRGVDFILVEAIDEENEGLAVMNRVRKAAGDVRFIEVS